MNVCVLGGSGFVGTELVIRLVRAGHWVRVPTRSLARAEQLRVLDTVELSVANVHEPRVLSQLFAGCDAVVNLIGILNPRRGASFDMVHTELAAKVMAAARTAAVRRVLHMSALGADSQAPSRYLRSKAAAEGRLRAPPHSEATRAEPWVTSFRPSVIFGPRDTLTNRFAELLRLTAGVLPLARARARFGDRAPDGPGCASALPDRAAARCDRAAAGPGDGRAAREALYTRQLPLAQRRCRMPRRRLPQARHHPAADARGAAGVPLTSRPRHDQLPAS
ncbi:MAG: NAD-dependent epimerase/dehydratase family protein [Gammaproteobacteria bacterium]|nr:MAG: NAD-dependent epimerase/dehydratase family protein [Gammaproteobacteria bacterium]